MSLSEFRSFTMLGQVYVVDMRERIAYFRLLRPYWKAAEHFGWTGADNKPGIDINRDVLDKLISEGTTKIRVFVSASGPDTVYEMGAKEWKSFSEGTSSMLTTKAALVGSVMLMHVPWGRFKSIKVETGSREARAFNAIWMVETGKRSHLG